MSLCWHIYELTRRGIWITGSITDTQLEIAADAVMEKAAKMREYVKYASIIDSPNFMESFFVGSESDSVGLYRTTFTQQKLAKQLSSLLMASISEKALDTLPDESERRDFMDVNVSEIDCVKLQKKRRWSPTTLWPSKCSQRRINN